MNLLVELGVNRLSIGVQTFNLGLRKVIQPAGPDNLVKELWTKTTRESYWGEFEPYFIADTCETPV
jgi:hypothetical protein